MAAKADKGSIYVFGPSQVPYIRFMEKLANQPDMDTTLKLHAILSEAYSETQAYVHVAKPKGNGSNMRVGGRLRASGRLQTGKDFSAAGRRRQFRGTISYGEGLDYAHYEFRRIGSRSDWMIHPAHDPYSTLDTHYEAVDRVIGGIFSDNLPA